MSKKNNRIAQQQVQDSKVKKNAKIISVLFWLGSSFYLYSTDIGFSDVYSWKPFVFFILGPLFAAVIFGNIIFSIQKVIEIVVIKICEQIKKVTGSNNLCLSGGVALNCVANGKILKEKIFENIWK
mgnify:CR=1 FL=1